MKPIEGYEDQYLISENGDVIRIETNRVLKPTTNKQTGYLYVGLWKHNVGKVFTVHRLVAKAYIPNPENKPEVNHKNSIRTDPRKENLEWVTRSENMIHGYEFGFMSRDFQKNFQDFELDILLQTMLSGENMTALAKAQNVGLSRLTINLRRRAKETNLHDQFCNELKAQKHLRAKISGKKLSHVIEQYTKDNEYLSTFNSLEEAANSVGLKSSGSISNALKNRNGQKYAKGYIWKYKQI